MSERRAMEGGDWINVVFNVFIGVLLGSVAHNLMQLVVSGDWLVALIMVILGVGFFTFMLLFDKLFDLLFSSWKIRPARKPRAEAPKPLLRVLSLPCGFLLGVGLAVLGLDRVLLDLLP